MLTRRFTSLSESSCTVVPYYSCSRVCLEIRESNPKLISQNDVSDRVRGCILAGAIGDAMGVRLRDSPVRSRFAITQIGLIPLALRARAKRKRVGQSR